MMVSWTRWQRRKWYILGAVVIAAVALVSYHPSMDIGFWADDYAFFETAARLSPAEYFTYYVDPRFAGQRYAIYRPIQGILWGIDYRLFGGEPYGYHLVQLAFHIANSLLLFGLASRLTRKWRIGLIAALLYATLPTYRLAVFWLGVVDPLASFFALVTMWFWLNYLECRGKGRWLLSFLFFLVALLSKEINITLPIALFLVDRFFAGKPDSVQAYTNRYVLFLLVLPLFVWIESIPLTQSLASHGLHFDDLGNMFSVFSRHVTTLAFPWLSNSLLNYAAMIAALGLLFYRLSHNDAKPAALLAMTLLPILPLLPFPQSNAAAPRYLYLPLMVTCTAIALIIDKAIQTLGGFRRAGALGASLVILATVLMGSATVSEDGLNFAGTARESRLQFRPIFQRHPDFAPDTLLYFVAPPFDSQYISGLMFRRYGKNISVSGTDRNQVPALRDHSAAFVFYRDGEEWREWAVDKNYSAVVAPSPPVRFDDVIALDGFEATSRQIKRGESTLLLLYWRCLRSTEKDYRIYVHLVDAQGTRVAAFDHQPQDGNAPTSSWKENNLVVDWVVVSASSDLDPGIYRIEIGWYDAQTGERLSRVKDGQRTDEMIAIEPVEVVK